MRKRLVLAFVGLALAVTGLYGVPRAYFLADQVRDQEADTLRGTATALAALATERIEHGGAVDTALLRSGLDGADRVALLAPDGVLLSAGQELDPDGVTETRTLSDGSKLQLNISSETVGASVREALTPLALVGLALTVASAGFGLILARRLSQPFQELAGHSRDLGLGRFNVEMPRYRVPEADAIGESLSGAATQLDGLIRREREFAANASHQLRTPITALRLSLEDLTMWPETAPEVRAELARGIGELDRLSGSIDELLDLAKGQRQDAEATMDLGTLVEAAAPRWRSRLAAEGRELVVRSSATEPTRVAPGPVEQILDVLLDNARLHGRGTVTVETRDAGTHLEASVSDEGERRIGPEIFQRGVSSRLDGEGHGIGLAVATELAEQCGGHLSLDVDAASTRLVLWLPRRVERRRFAR